MTRTANGSIVEESESSKLSLAIPPRRASLELPAIIDDQDSSSPNNFDDTPAPYPPPIYEQSSVWQSDSPAPISILKTSKSMGCISPIGRLQVQEACELRERLQMSSHDAKKFSFPTRRKPTASMSVDQLVPDKRSEPQSWHQRIRSISSSRGKSARSPSKQFLPTLFTARTPSQRLNGHTGVAATEPANLAKARLGFKLKFPTLSSKVSLSSPKPASLPQSKSMTSLPLTMHRNLGIGLPESPVLPAEHEMQAERERQRRRNRHAHARQQAWNDADVCETDAEIPDGFVLVTTKTSTYVEIVEAR